MFNQNVLKLFETEQKPLSIASGADSLQTYQHVHQCGWGGRMNFTSSSIQNHFKLCRFFVWEKKRRWKDGKTSQSSDFLSKVPKTCARNAGYLVPTRRWWPWVLRYKRPWLLERQAPGGCSVQAYPRWSAFNFLHPSYECFQKWWQLPPNHPIWIGFSIKKNHPFWGTPIFGKSHTTHNTPWSPWYTK